MTKQELIAALAPLADNAEVLVQCVATVAGKRDFLTMVKQAAADTACSGRAAELSVLTTVENHEDFAVIVHKMEYLDQVETEIAMADHAFDAATK